MLLLGNSPHNNISWSFSRFSSYYEKFADGKVVCIDDEIPFEIPSGWVWCRLGSLVDFSKSKSVKANNIAPDAWLLDLEDIEKDSGKILHKKRKGPTTSISDKHRFERGNVLYSKLRPYLNKVIIADEDGYCTSEILCFDFGMIYNKYAQLFLMSPFFVEYAMSDAYGVKMPRLGSKQGNNGLIPIPPREEQTRIVNFINSLEPYIEKYSNAQASLDIINKEVKNTLKKSILQEAIRGKLVTQDNSDESASILLQRIKEEKLRLVKEGKLKKKDVIDSTIFRGDDNKYFEKKDKDIICIDEEIPFEIPDTWVWVRLEDICEYIQRGKSPKYSPVKKYPVIAQKCNQWSGFSIEKAQFIVPETISSYGEERKLQDKDLLWNSTGLGTLGRMAIYYSKLNPYESAVADSHVTVIRPLKKHVSPEYLYAYFSSYTVQSVIEDKSDGSTKQKELATNTVKAYLVPLPPYEEQKRIVNRIDEVISHLT